MKGEKYIAVWSGDYGHMRLISNERGIISQYFVIIIGLFVVVMLLLVAGKIIFQMVCMHSIGSVANDVERVREVQGRLYAGAPGSMETIKLNLPVNTKYCFLRGQVYIEGTCISEGYRLPHQIVNAPVIDAGIRGKVEEMASLVQVSDDEASTSTVCLTSGFYSITFERTQGHVNLHAVFGTKI